MGEAVVHADIELFLTGWIRAALDDRSEPFCAGVEVDNKEPPPEEDFPARLVVVRFDGSTETSLVTEECSVGITVLAGTKRQPQDAVDLARLIRALVKSLPSTDQDNPVAAVLSTTGPLAVLEPQDRSRRYLTLTLSLVGKAL